MDIFILVSVMIAAAAFIFIPPFSFLIYHGWWALAWVTFSILVCAGIGGYIYDHTPPPEHFTLNTSDWECVSTYQERHFNGKIWTTVTRCSAYAKRERP